MRIKDEWRSTKLFEFKLNSIQENYWKLISLMLFVFASIYPLYGFIAKRNEALESPLKYFFYCYIAIYVAVVFYLNILELSVRSDPKYIRLVLSLTLGYGVIVVISFFSYLLYV